MRRDVLQVDFQPENQGPRRPVWTGEDVIWAVLGALALLVIIALAVELLPFLLVVLGVAAVLAALSTWKAARRRRILMQYGWPASRVEVKTYLAYLAGWFIGLLIFVPLLFFGAVIAVGVLTFVGVVLVISLIAGLFRIQ